MKRNERFFEDSVMEQKSELEREKRRRKAKLRKLMTGLDRLFGFMLVTVLVIAIAGFGAVYVLTKGPSETLKQDFVMTMLETRRFDFIANLFLTVEEVGEIKGQSQNATVQEFDANLIKIDSGGSLSAAAQTGAYLAQDDDGDGIIYEEIQGSGYVGYVITVLDPKRVVIGMPDSFGGVGLTLEDMVKKYDAIGGINAGAFKDDGGGGLGGVPEGLTIIDGVVHGNQNAESPFVGFDDSGKMFVGYYTAWAATERDHIRNGVSFGPILIMNGEPCETGSSSVNPRTAIGQREDGAVIMLVIDGRQVHSMGATYRDCMEIMLARGAVNAINMDGGSSTCMYYNGEYVNRSSGATGVRLLPSAFVFR